MWSGYGGIVEEAEYVDDIVEDDGTMVVWLVGWYIRFWK